MSAILRTAATGVLRRHWVHSARNRWESGFLVEPAATNVLLRSQEFNTGWTAVSAGVTTNAVTAPDGTLTADAIFENTDVGQPHGYVQSYTSTSGATQAISCFVKADTRSWVVLQMTDGGGTNGCRAWVNLATGALGASAVFGTGTYTAHYATFVGDGWWRCVLVGRAATATTVTVAGVYASTGDTVYTYTGDGASRLFAWGAQAENGASWATSYIPTTTTSVTRNADAWSRAVAGTPAVTPGPVTLYARHILTAPLAVLGSGVYDLRVYDGARLLVGKYSATEWGFVQNTASAQRMLRAVGSVPVGTVLETWAQVRVGAVVGGGVSVNHDTPSGTASGGTVATAPTLTGSLAIDAVAPVITTHVALLGGLRTFQDCRAAAGAA